MLRGSDSKFNTFTVDKYAPQFFQGAKDRDADKLQECLDNGLGVNSQELSSGNTALHYLLSDGCFCKKCLKKLKKCLEKILHNGADPNLMNNKRTTPLEFATNNMIPFDLVKLMLEHGATVVTENGIQNRKLMKQLVEKMPGAVCEILNKGVNFKPESVNDEGNKVVQLDWRHLIYSPNPEERHHWKETEFLYDVVRKGTIEGKRQILTHPLVKAYLILKTPNYWWPFGLFYCTWITVTFGLYLTFIWTLYNDTCRYRRNATSTDAVTPANNEGINCKISQFETVIAYFILVFYLVGPVGLELRKFLTLGLKVWLKQWQNYIFLPASALVLITLYPALGMDGTYTLTWQYPSAAIGMLVGSISIMIQMTPVPFVALYLEMLFKVFLRIVIAAIALCPVYLGFFFSFRILLTKEHIGWFQLFTMIVSDSDYEDLMDEDRGDYYEIVAYVFFSAFIVLVVIVVLNLLIGLAVSDVDKLKDYANVTNLGNKVRSYYLADGVYRKDSNKFVTTHGFNYEFQPLNDKAKDTLSRSLRIELLELARNCCCHPGGDEKHNGGRNKLMRTSSAVNVKMDE